MITAQSDEPREKFGFEQRLCMYSPSSSCVPFRQLDCWKTSKRLFVRGAFTSSPSSGEFIINPVINTETSFPLPFPRSGSTVTQLLIQP
ncbi:hypothetical protein EYF80_045219 [Liparis tanakae]|uniref:Uncharacterized protein n=1 Tax=Liparis tanakae TaxID=230148 RepID=A0A4Z2FTI9_9TELE|nr:hypothetical protein EYF80_045219 [Liparis tanakae]